MDPALAATLGVAGFVLALTSLAWNVTQFVLTGLRIRIKLGTKVSGGRIVEVSQKAPSRRHRWRSQEVMSTQIPYGVALLTATVHNGRLPVTIDHIGVHAGRHGRSYADPKVQMPYRLEPHASVTWTTMLMDGEGVAKLAKKKRFHVVVTLGTGKTYRSRASYDVTGPRPNGDDQRWLSFLDGKPLSEQKFIRHDDD
ncbi:hypothetical protein [Plantibacter cousiniae (nom. nud.)]|uniref:hypothetical protein n=1 Tax=Plantibacter cousiniae (nom. nud.) TaxID=199709 RepID=UPI001D57CD6D|nr:hypothetical protein [Plantibacter cousiniae]CAH0266427.1 hypothetical protein SRABI02_03558 [Plantibacter cousiniae]